MTIQNFIFGSIISIFFGSLFHFWRRGGGGKLLVYLLLAFAGFWAGHFLGSVIEIDFLILGPLNLGLAIISSIIALFLGQYLSEINPDQY